MTTVEPLVVYSQGLSNAPIQHFVAIVGIERFSGMREDLGEQCANIVIDALWDRIRLCDASVHLGRINRSSIEFTFHAESLDEAEQTLVQLQKRLHAPVVVANRSLALDVAIGFAGRDKDCNDLGSVIDRAEHALARARAGNVKIGAFTQSDVAERTHRLELLRDLRVAVNSDDMFVCYQPKLNLRSSSISSAEALVRWRRPAEGLVAPDKFIRLAEDSGEIRALTEMVIGHVLKDSDELARAGLTPRLDLNVSGSLVADEDFAQWALGMLQGRTGKIGFEITETAVISNPERALAHIHAFSAAGIAIAIDDYGSGLSSLSYLKQIPAHELKIDQAFISELTNSHRDPLLVRSTIDLAHALEMQVTAEGVESAMTLALLRVMGCDMAQGYYIAEPLVFDEFINFLQNFAPETYMRSPEQVFAKRVNTTFTQSRRA